MTDKKRRNPARRVAFWAVFFASLTLGVWLSPTARTLRALPAQLTLTAGQSQVLSLGLPFSVAVTGDAQVLSSCDEQLGSVRIGGEAAAEAELTINLLGWLPVKQFRVDITENRVLIPGGQAVGVALNTKGVLVVGLSDLSAHKSPARAAGVQAGDVITALDGAAVRDADHLTALVAASGGKPLTLSLLRGGKAHTLAVTPRIDGEQYRLGVWVRDSTAGVGTLSYYDPESGAYGALGHAIADGDTGQTLLVRDGEILKADVVDVRKGLRGTPGELRGSFLREQQVLGDIRVNNIYGIYGTMAGAPAGSPYPDGLPIALQSAVHTGPATILSTIEGDAVREYAVEITSVTRQGSPAQKSMTLRVTDERLLEATGGIVQGMSGSPIVQDGHIIGAVTHVFVNDPTQGYGLYIEWMLAQSEALADTLDDAA